MEEKKKPHWGARFYWRSEFGEAGISNELEELDSLDLSWLKKLQPIKKIELTIRTQTIVNTFRFRPEEKNYTDFAELPNWIRCSIDESRYRFYKDWDYPIRIDLHIAFQPDRADESIQHIRIGLPYRCTNPGETQIQ